MRPLLRSSLVAPLRPFLVASLIAVPMTVLFGGCNKDNGDAPVKKSAVSAPAVTEDTLLATPILQRIPATSAGFMVLDFDGPGYAEFKRSPWVSQMNGLGSITTSLEEMQKAGAPESQVAAFQSVLEALKQIGLLSSSGESMVEKVASKVVWFVDLPKDLPEAELNGGLFVAGAKGANLKEKLSILEGVMKERGLLIQKEEIAGTAGLAVTIPASTEGAGVPVINKFYIAATDSLLGISRLKSSVESLIKGENPGGLTALSNRPEFTKTLHAVGSSDTSLSLMFVSLAQAGPALEKLSAGSPPGERYDGKQVPVEAFALRQAIGKQFSTRAALALTPKDDSQKAILTAIESASLPVTASQLPTDTALALSLDTKFLPKMEAILRSVEGDAAASGLGQLANLKGATIGLRNNDGGSPLPDLFIGLDTTNRNDAVQILEGVLGQGMASMGTPGMQWQTKEISGTPVKFFTTLLGVGIYLATPKDSSTILLSSSERAMKDFLTAASTPSASLGGSLTGTMKDRFAAGRLGSSYVNFANLATIVDSVKGSLGMFLGGAGGDLDKALDTKNLKNWGVHVGSIAYADGALTIDASFDPPAGR